MGGDKCAARRFKPVCGACTAGTLARFSQASVLPFCPLPCYVFLWRSASHLRVLPSLSGAPCSRTTSTSCQKGVHHKGSPKSTWQIHVACSQGRAETWSLLPLLSPI